MIALIAAVNEKNTLGLNGKMPWHVPEDLKFFRQTTLNQKLAMGRKTFDGLPKHLDQRDIYVVTRQENAQYEHVVHDFPKFLETYKESSETLYVAGGGELYAQAIGFADTLIISRIPNDVLGDTFFPTIDPEQFECVETIQKETFQIEIYERKY